MVFTFIGIGKEVCPGLLLEIDQAEVWDRCASCVRSQLLINKS